MQNQATQNHWTSSNRRKKIDSKDIISFLSMMNGSGNETMSGIFFFLRAFISCSFWRRHRIFVTYSNQYRGWPRDLCSNYNKPVDWMDHSIELTHSTRRLNQFIPQYLRMLHEKTNTKLVKFAKEATLNDKRISVLCAAFTPFFSLHSVRKLCQSRRRRRRKKYIIIKSINFCP